MKVFGSIREWRAIIGSSSVYAAAGMGGGGAVALITQFFPELGLNPFTVFLYSFPIPVAVLYFWFSSDRSFRKRLKFLKDLHAKGLIEKPEYDLYRKLALRWYGERWFGRAGVEAPPAEPPLAPPTPGADPSSANP